MTNMILKTILKRYKTSKKKPYTKKCEFQDCSTSASFAPLGQSAKRCKKHILPGDGNVKCRVCVINGCVKRATHSPEGSLPLRCIDHVFEDDFASYGTCFMTGCRTKSSFGTPGCKSVSCKKHKMDHHVNINSCEVTGCSITPGFAPLGHRALRCRRHKFESDIDTRNRMCIGDGCSKRPVFGVIGSRAKWCKVHKLDIHVNVNVGKKC